MSLVAMSGGARLRVKGMGLGLTIAAEAWRWDGNTGSVKVSSGFPMRPGHLTDANLAQVRVYVDGVEQAVALNPLRGKFPDGSYRSLGVQFVYTLTNATPVSAEVRINQGIRGTVDIAWEEPIYTSATMSVAAANHRAVLQPTDAAYKCAAFVTFVPLQPEASDVANTTIFGLATADELGEWADGLKAEEVGNPLTLATYDHVGGLFAGWQRGSGALARQFYQWGYDRLFYQMRGTTGTQHYFLPGSSSASYAQLTSVDPSLGEPPSEFNGLVPEWHMGAYMGWATGYLVTAWKQPWRQLSHKVSWEWFWSTYGEQATWIQSSGGGMRMNSWRCTLPIAASLVEATMQVAGGYGAGRNQGTAPHLFATQIPWIYDAWEDAIYTAYTDPLGGGTGATGIVGQAQTEANCAHDPTRAGHFPLFQLMTVTRVLHLLYNNFPTDSRVPTWIKTAADFILSQSRDVGGQMAWPYEMQLPASTTSTVDYFQQFYRELFAFAYALEADPTDKATYLTALDKCLNRAVHDGEILAWKQFGENFHAGQQSALYYRDGGTVRGVSGVHPTTITDPPKHTS